MPKVYASEKELAIKLRQEGKSYREIQKATGVRSRGTLSLWFKNIILSPDVQKIIDSRRLCTQKNVLLWSKARSEQIKIENSIITAQSIKEVGVVLDRELLFIGAALYWGEGSLRMNKHGYHRFKFSNSSPEMVKTFLAFTRRVLNISDDQMRPTVHIHPNIGAHEAITFWSAATKLQPALFKTYNAISSASKGKRPPHFLPYGTFQLTINGRQNFYRIRGYIDGIIKQIN